MGEAEAITLFKRAARSVWVGAFACVALLALGHFLRQLDIVLNPLAWSAAEIIAALLCFSIAANVLVRDHGTGNRVSLLLGLTFGITGIIHLGAILEFYHAFANTTDQIRIPLSWMMGQTLLGLLFLAAYAINKHLPWPRGPKKNILAVLSTIVATLCLITIVLLIFPGEPTIRAHGPVPRPWDLLPAAVFLAAAFVLHRRGDREHLAFDAVLAWVAGLNAAGHLIASQSARLLDAAAGGAVLLNTLSYLVLLVATLVDNVQIFRQVRILAISDSLTGLANYRRLVDVLQSELERSGRTNRSFSVLLMDLDGLKRINDRHGHLAGSEALCRVASILRLNCRSIDTAARYGGDEFALVLPETKQFAAQQVSDRIRKCLHEDEESPRLSLSVGIATFPQCGATVQELLEYADRALYEMKSESKGRKPQNHSR
jgi:diguanylate cyclase (GGDEF)-like protein